MSVGVSIIIKVLEYDQGSITSNEFLSAENFHSVIAPNPVSELLTLETKALDVQLKEIRIYNQIGQLAFASGYADFVQLDVSDWSPGLYLLQYVDERKQKSRARKFIVK